MSEQNHLPKILIVDDLFGRTHPEGRNEERANLCGQYLLKDVTGDEQVKASGQKIKKPIAEAVFFRGQSPTCSIVGDTVENNLEHTLQIIREGWDVEGTDKPRWAMILLDLCFYTGRVTKESDAKASGMPEGRVGDDSPDEYFGLQILRKIREEFPEIPIVILSSKSRDEVSQEFSQLGAMGFLPRADANSPEMLSEYLWRHGLIQDEQGEIVGQSKALLLALRAARRAAIGKRNILVRGERGTGKELIARYIHRQADSQQAPFIEVNSSALTPELFASELFGIGAGVATGVTKRLGLIKEADGGDLFLDEIKDMPSTVQAGILRVLEERKMIPVGASTPIVVDVRFLSATNIDIEGLAVKGGFRSDLLDRLREGGTIVLPALRDRKEDIPLLIERFVREAESTHPSAVRRQIDPETIEKLCGYDWPGNIRELKSCLFKAVNDHPDVEHLVPIHIAIPDEATAQEIEPGQEETLVSQVQPDFQINAVTISQLMQVLATASIDTGRPEEITGKLPELQHAYAEFIARYFRNALEVTRRPTPDNPQGKIQIHPAVKLIMGDSRLTASKAADIVKKIHGISKEAAELWDSDPVLRAAYETALRLRPRKANAKVKVSLK